MSPGEKIKRIAKVLKTRFTNMTVDETIDLAQAILDALEAP